VVRRLTVCFCVAIGVLGFASAATAAPCGKAAKKGKPPLTGTLLLRAEESTTELSFKRDTDKRKLIFVFDVKDCRLPTATDGTVGAKIRSSDLDVEKVFGTTHVESEGSILTVEVAVNPEEFDAGKHSAAVTVRGVGITPTTAKVSLQRTEALGLPTLIFLACALIGSVAAMLVCGASLQGGSLGKFLGSLAMPGKALVAAVIAAGAVWWASYVQADVWELELETVGILVIGALPAAYGAAIRVLQVGKVEKN
jgi:hypothetical protein